MGRLKLSALVLGLLTLGLAVVPVPGAAASDEWKRAYGPYVPGEYSSLPHEMTPEEQTQWQLRRPPPPPSNPPPSPVRNVAEFEPMQGALVRYPLGISYSLVREMSMDVVVYTIVSSETVKNQAIANFTSNGVNMANVQFIIAPTDSIYTRDYGPWGIFDGTNNFAVMDFPYNRPRPNDDAIPGKVSAYLGEPMFTMGLVYGGGNYMTDGLGIAVSTDLVVTENPNKTVSDIKQTAKDFLGIHTFHIVPDTTGTYIKHVDTWVKFLAVDKIMIRRVPPSHPHYQETEAAVSYFSGQFSSYGTPYRIYRVATPNNEPYANSLILNNKILVPIMNSPLDAEAIAAYKAAMPGYTVIGFTGSWVPTDALHCRVMGIPDTGMLYIHHAPVVDDQPTGQPIEIRSTVIAHSGQTLQPGSPALLWKTASAGTYNTVQMAPAGPNEYQGFIPAQAAAGTVQYYIHAADGSGRAENHPFIGAADPHVITIAGGTTPTPPAAPSSLAVTSSSSTQISLSWTDNANNETGFKIERKIGPRGNFVQIATVGANVTTYTDSSVTPGQQHTYRIRATNAAGDSAYSNTASALP